MKKRGIGKRKANGTRFSSRFPQLLFIILALIVVSLALLNFAKVMGWLIPERGEIIIDDGVVILDSMTIEQKIGQMLVVPADPSAMNIWKKMNIGGIHLFSRKSESVFMNTIIDFQYDSKIPFFVTADFEGCITPFAHLVNSSPNSKIDDLGSSFKKGFNDGKYLKHLGFNLNFAPVVDLDDSIWKCRSFPGNSTQIAELAQAYTLGLQDQGIIATAKHYPGKTLIINDPHKFVVSAKIALEDIYPYHYLIERGDIKAIMVSHLITEGAIDTKGIPSVVSKEIIDDIKKDYDGLIISDEIHMLGLKNFYPTVDEMYIAIFKAGNDIILDFDHDPNEINRLIMLVADSVRKEEIPEKQIDASVTKILQAKGLKVR